MAVLVDIIYLMGRSIPLSSEPPVLFPLSKRPIDASFWDNLTSSPTMALQALLLIGLVLLLLRAGRILRLCSRIPPVDRLLLGIWSLVGLVLRLWNGIRVPGWINSHGYELLRDVLIGVPSAGPDPHGNGFYALYGLVTSVLPATELTIISFQCFLSVLSIPLVYLVARFWFEHRSPAFWSAAAMAVFPSVCFFATTEVHMVPGCLFMLVVLALIAASIRLRDPVLTVSAALLGAVTTQFHPVWMILPLVVLLFTLSAPGCRALFRSGWTWLAVGLFGVLWLGPAVWMTILVGSRPGGAIGPDFLRVFETGHFLFTPSFDLSFKVKTNVFLNHNFIPPVFALLAVIGLVSGPGSSRKRVAVSMSILGCALFMTLPGLMPGGINPARLQLGATPFYAMLCGAGLAWLAGRIRLSSPRKQAIARQLSGAALILGAVVIWPGVLEETFTPQLERRVFDRGLGSLDEGCLVIWPPHPRGGNNPIPYYLAEQKGLSLTWANLLQARVPGKMIEKSSCSVYYRPSTCYLVLSDQPGDEHLRLSPGGLRPVCARIERQLGLTPLHTERIPARPDYMGTYSKAWLEIGFYRIDEVLAEEVKAPDPP